MKKYVCIVPYHDNYAKFDVGEVITVGYVGASRDMVLVYPKNRHPLPMEAFKFCFIEKEA